MKIIKITNYRQMTTTHYYYCHLAILIDRRIFTPVDF